jgi:N-acetylglucosaminyldiphosphoundecaprenol N-acetyl-beta-D-mannosaminyltransferase
VLDGGKRNVLGVLVDVVDYEAVLVRTIEAAMTGRPFAVSALAVHGVMSGRDPAQRRVLNNLDIVAPDGQPVRWGLNLLHRTGLRQTVRGSNLALKLLQAAAENDVPVFFYGSRPEVLESLLTNVRSRFPGLTVAGSEPSKFRAVNSHEREAIVARIKSSGARLVFVGLGCPRQEVFVHELREELSMPLVAVGAAFDYLGGFLHQPPQRIQRAGLEWLWRLLLEPRRLWRRYVLLNPLYLAMLACQAIHVWTPAIEGSPPAAGRALDA